jgi:hypothetical protein
MIEEGVNSYLVNPGNYQDKILLLLGDETYVAEIPKNMDEYPKI